MLCQTSLNNCVFNGGARPPCLQLVAGGGDRHHWRGHREQGEGGHQVFEKYQLVITIVIIIIAIVIIVIVLLLLLLLYCYCIVIVIATESRARVAARFFTLGTCIFKEGSRQVFEKMSTCYCGPVYYTELMFQTCHVIFIDWHQMGASDWDHPEASDCTWQVFKSHGTYQRVPLIVPDRCLLSQVPQPTCYWHSWQLGNLTGAYLAWHQSAPPIVPPDTRLYLTGFQRVCNLGCRMHLANQIYYLSQS